MGPCIPFCLQFSPYPTLHPMHTFLPYLPHPLPLPPCPLPPLPTGDLCLGGGVGQDPATYRTVRMQVALPHLAGITPPAFDFTYHLPTYHLPPFPQVIPLNITCHKLPITIPLGLIGSGGDPVGGGSVGSWNWAWDHGHLSLIPTSPPFPTGWWTELEAVEATNRIRHESNMYHPITFQ